MSVRVIGYSADADTWCAPCCQERYDGEYDSSGDWYATDHEGNEVWPIFSTDECATSETCRQCGENLIDCNSYVSDRDLIRWPRQYGA